MAIGASQEYTTSVPMLVVMDSAKVAGIFSPQLRPPTKPRASPVNSIPIASQTKVCGSVLPRTRLVIPRLWFARKMEWEDISSRRSLQGSTHGASTSTPRNSFNLGYIASSIHSLTSCGCRSRKRNGEAQSALEG